MKKYDIVIVGGGVVGLSIAYHLLKMDRSLEIAVLEKKYIGYGGSTRNAGHFRVHFWTWENSLYASKSVKMLLKFQDETGWNPTIYMGGYLWLISDDRVLKAYEDANREIWSRLGNPVEIWDVERVRERYPYINLNGFKYAVYGPQDGKLHHDQVVFGYYSKVVEMGGEVHQYTPVNKIRVREGSVQEVVSGIRRFKTDKVVVAAGEGSKKIFGELSIDLPITVKRKELYVSEPYRIFIDPLVIDTRPESQGLYVSQTPRGEVLGSIDYPEYYNDFTHETTLKHYLMYSKLVSKLIPSLRASTVMRVWSGNYVVTPDNSHIMGRVDEWPEGLYIATGFSGHGFMMAPYTGLLMAKLLLKESIDRDMEPYLPSRFSENKLIREMLVIG